MSDNNSDKSNNPDEWIDKLKREVLVLELSNRHLPIDGAVAVLRERLRKFEKEKRGELDTAKEIVDRALDNLQQATAVHGDQTTHDPTILSSVVPQPTQQPLGPTDTSSGTIKKTIPPSTVPDHSDNLKQPPNQRPLTQQGPNSEKFPPYHGNRPPTLLNRDNQAHRGGPSYHIGYDRPLENPSRTKNYRPDRFNEPSSSTYYRDRDYDRRAVRDSSPQRVRHIQDSGYCDDYDPPPLDTSRDSPTPRRNYLTRVEQDRRFRQHPQRLRFDDDVESARYGYSGRQSPSQIPPTGESSYVGALDQTRYRKENSSQYHRLDTEREPMRPPTDYYRQFPLNSRDIRPNSPIQRSQDPRPRMFVDAPQNIQNTQSIP